MLDILHSTAPFNILL